MTIKQPFAPQFILAALLTLLLAPQLQAQSDTPEESRPVRLTWTEDNNVLRYEVSVEKEEENSYQRVLKKFTDTSSIEISLLPGKYRCQVIPYDFLDKPGAKSQWINFEVHAPRPPEPDMPAEAAVPLTYTIAHQELIIQPGKEKKAAFYLGAAWMPVLPIYGNEKTNFGQEDFTPSGAGLRFGVIFAPASPFNIGLELAGSWYDFDAALYGNGNSTYHAATAALNLVLQKQFLNRLLALRFRLGGGVALPAEEHYPHANLGVSLAWFPAKHFFLETGLDYVHMFSDAPSGCLRPWIGMGVQW